MKNFKLLLVYALCIAGLWSCSDNDTSKDIPKNSAEKSKNSTARLAGAPWVKQFEDTFNVGSNLSQWNKEERSDFNSWYCDYKSYIPTTQWRDGRQCLEIRTTKRDNYKYFSGLISSKYQYTPENNSEYMLSANIKLIAYNGSGFKSFRDTYGAWPAFWSVQGQSWPTKGEIDVMEAYSFAPNNPNVTSNLFYSTVVDKNALGQLAERKYPSGFNLDSNNGWHLYESFWKKKNNVVTVTIMVDNILVAIYDNRTAAGLVNLNNFVSHSIILNMNVGSKDSSFIDPNKINLFSGVAMWVDDVTVYKKPI